MVHHMCESGLIHGSCVPDFSTDTCVRVRYFLLIPLLHSVAMAATDSKSIATSSQLGELKTNAELVYREMPVHKARHMCWKAVIIVTASLTMLVG